MTDKIFKTHDEQISLLESRGICFPSRSDKSNLKKALQRIGYYNLINGYNKLFLVTKIPEDQYLPGTTFNEIFSLYNFDRDLREIFLETILPFETNVKTLIAYCFSKSYGHDNYLKFTNFDTRRRDAHKKVTAIISEFQHQIAARSSDPSIMHYLQKYGYVPLWVANGVLTFGQISKFYTAMKQVDRQEVSRVFHVQDSELESIMYYLSSVRNFCAHGNRLYCYRSGAPLIDLSVHNQLSIPRNPNGWEYLYGKRDLFAAALALKTVTAKSAFGRLVNKLNSSINKHLSKLKVISVDDVLYEMGFPMTWKSDLLQ